MASGTASPPLRARPPSRRRTIAATGAAGLLALVLGACGSGTHFANLPRPPITVDLSVYVDNSHVSISPSHVGAGPVILYVTNQASRARTVAIRSASGASLGSSGLINSGQTAQISTDLNQPGTYMIQAGGAIRAARLRIGKPRPNADSALLQP